MKNLKRNLLLLVAFLFFVPSFAANFYWVGGTGIWKDAKHWSLTSGGLPGTAIPTANDDVFFDQHSFSADRQTVMVTVDAVCRNIDWSAIDDKAVFSTVPPIKLSVYGSYTLSPILINGFKGETVFTSAASSNSISLKGNTIIGNWEFNGSGSWILLDDLTTEKNVSIKLIKGNLNTNGQTVYCGSFIGNSSQKRSLKLSSSEIYIKDKWDFSTTSQLKFDAGTSRIIFEDSLNDNKFRSGGLKYKSVSAAAGACTPSGNPCSFFTISLTGTNVVCNGANNGTITATVLPAAAYTYFWSPAPTAGQNTANATVGPGTYTLKVTNGAGQFCFCTYQISEPGQVFVYEFNTTQPSCNGQCNAQSIITSTGGIPPYTYTWTGGLASNDTVTNVCAGNYSVVVSDSKGCNASTDIIIAQPDILVAPGTTTNVTCKGFCNGTASVNPSGGTSPYYYNWTPGNPTGDGTANITALCPGSYTCTVTDTNACVATFNSTITEPLILTLNVTKTDATCKGTCDGTATATVSGGTTPYTYSWSNGTIVTTASTSNTISGLCANTYSVTVTDANGCLLNSSATVIEPSVLIATASKVNAKCFGACNGTASVVVFGGNTGTKTYDWTPGTPAGDGTASVTGLCPNTYTVTVTDSLGCNDTGVVVVTQPLVLDANPIDTDVLCQAACNGTATASPTGGITPYTYNWSPGGQTTASILGLCPGNYSVTVLDANLCSSIKSVTISEPPLLVPGVSSTNITCNGACDGTATATPSGGTGSYTYSWSPGGQTTASISGLCPGSYTVTVKDGNNCSKTGTVIITQTNVLTVSIDSTTLSCYGNCNATAVATVAGGTAPYTFNWSPGAPIGDGTTIISSLCAGNYSLLVVDKNNCSATASTTISQPPPLVLSNASAQPSCFDICDASVGAVAGGGTAPYHYLWSPGGDTTQIVNGQCDGSYIIKVTDKRGCIISDTIAIVDPLPLISMPSVLTNISCAGILPCDGSATASQSGGTPRSGSAPYTYSWSPGGLTTPTITSLCAGTYNLTVKDSNLCSSTKSVTITQPLVLSAPITSSTSSCNICNGTATVTPAGGTFPYTYTWMPGGQTTQTATGLCANMTYTVTVRDSAGCTAISSIKISPTVIIRITTSNTVLTCFNSCDGIATANAAGGTPNYQYLWSGPGGIAITQTISGLCAGKYKVRVTDAIGCYNTDSVTFTNRPLLTHNPPTIISNVTCGGGSNGSAKANFIGGTLPYSYSWNSSPVQTTQTASGLPAGSYIVTVTDSSGCTDTTHITITEPTTVTDSVTVNDANCLQADGSIAVFLSGGIPPYTCNWGSGQSTATITNLLPGAYTLSVTDFSGCIFNFNYLLNNKTGPSLVTSHSNVSCNNLCDGTANVVATPGAGVFIYSWAPGTPTGDSTSAITALCGTTTYTVTVRDAAGCITLDTATIIKPEAISPNPNFVHESCGGLGDGSITLIPSGGSGNYTYLWNNGSTASSIDSLSAGVYTVTISDANNPGCDTALTFTINSPLQLTAGLSSTNVLCNSACDGTAIATVVGGTGPGTYKYVWSHNPALVLPNVVNLCPNSYFVIVTDSSGCTASDTVTITQPTALITSTSKKDASCFGVCNGRAIVFASGGTSPYTYSWNSGAITNDTASALCAGICNAMVTDSNGCTSSSAVTIIAPAQIDPKATVTNHPSCYSSCNGTAIANPTGGSGSYTYLWSDPLAQTTQTATGLCDGSYSVKVFDGAGCSASQFSINLTEPLELFAGLSFVSPTCSNNCDGSVTATPVGGTGAKTYSWSTSDITQIVNNLCPGNYTAIVTDGNNCKDTATINLANTTPLNLAVGSTPAACGACDGTINVTPNGTPPYTYIWTIGGVAPPPPFSGTASVTNVCAGLYSVYVRDSKSCDSTFTIALSNASGPTSEIVSTIDATCFGSCNGAGSLDSIIGGFAPFDYLWNNPAADTTKAASNLCAGPYQVQVTDAFSCIHFSPVTIGQPDEIESNDTITTAVCSGVCTGKITINPSGGTPPYNSFAWSPGVIPGTTSVSGLCPGTYTLTFIDVNTCPKVDSFTVTQSAPLSGTIASDTISCSSACSGMAYVKITTGTPPYTIQWNDPLGQTNDTANALCAGNYTVNIRDGLGCVLTLNTTIIAIPAISASALIADASCGLCDGSALITPTGGTGGYTYLWSNGQTTTTATSLCSGLYTVDIKDSVGCVTNIAIPVDNSTGPTSATITATNVTCNGLNNGSVKVFNPVGGIAPYSYLWIPGGQTTFMLSNLYAGIYFVQITDANGCSLIDSITIYEPSPINANKVITAPSCNAFDGTISITPSGGTGPYIYSWNTGSTSPTLNNLGAGVYSVKITDNLTCVKDVFISLNSKNGPTLTTTITNASCNASCNGSASVVATGSSPIAFLWNDSNAQTNDTASSLCAGTYFVTVTNAGGCMSIASATITEPDSIGFSVINSIDPLCNGDVNGSITVIPSGGTMPYAYVWTPAPASGQTTSSAVNLDANTYNVTLTDAKGCTASQTATLVNPPQLIISNILPVISSCNTIPDGSIDVTVVGGTTPYQYLWTGASSAPTEDLVNVLSGSYTITVTDSKTCVVDSSITLLASQTVIANVGNDTTFCQLPSLTLDASASVNGVNYQWFDMPTNTLMTTAATITINQPSGSSSYYVKVDNGTGCADADTINITSNPIPTANAGPDLIIVLGTSAVIGGNPTTSAAGATFLWTPIPSALDNQLSPNPVASPKITTTYTVTVTSDQGCAAVDSMLATVLPQVDIPDGITPNGDGKNDEWVIGGIELYPNCKVEVYNRWGELLFQSPGYKDHWKGTYKGKALPVGTYYYVVDLNDPLFPDAYTGPITILR